MASLANDPGGRRRILFVDSEGNRKAIRLGKKTKGPVFVDSIKVGCHEAFLWGDCDVLGSAFQSANCP